VVVEVVLVKVAQVATAVVALGDNVVVVKDEPWDDSWMDVVLVVDVDR